MPKSRDGRDGISIKSSYPPIRDLLNELALLNVGVLYPEDQELAYPSSSSISIDKSDRFISFAGSIIFGSDGFELLSSSSARYL